jgi:hypothetical protein
METRSQCGSGGRLVKSGCADVGDGRHFAATISAQFGISDDLD